MSWKILDKDQEAIDLVSDVISSGAKTGYDLDEVYDAFDRVVDLAKKGMLAEKFKEEL
tara:strand:+ start:599 stop:772 length:174 start_codon:yes stop_codon:yes gene_type:complete